MAITLIYMRFAVFALNTSLQRPHAFPRKCPRFDAGSQFVLERKGRSQYSPGELYFRFGYFVVLPACGSRNDRLFINDLSLSILWTITSRFLGVSQSSPPSPRSPILFLSATGPWHLESIVAPEGLLRSRASRIPSSRLLLPQNGLRHDSSND